MQLEDVERVRRLGYHIDIQPLHLFQPSLRVVGRRQVRSKHHVFVLMVFLDALRNFRQAFRTIKVPVHGQSGAKEERL